MRKTFLATLLATVAIPMLPMAAFAQSSAPPPPAPTSSGQSLAVSNLDPIDAKFIQTAGAAGLAEVEDGQLAQQKGSPAVQKIGATMVTDHTAVNAKLKAIALRDGVMIGTTLTDKDAAINSKLSNLSGSAFDAEYLKTQKMAHKKAIALFQAEATTGTDANLKALAASSLPTLKSHLQMLQAAPM